MGGLLLSEKGLGHGFNLTNLLLRVSYGLSELGSRCSGNFLHFGILALSCLVDSLLSNLAELLHGLALFSKGLLKLGN